MVAAAAGHMAAVQALLKGGADPLACDSKQRRASTLAQMQGHSDVLGVLAEAERSRSDGAGKKKARSRKSSGGHARIGMYREDSQLLIFFCVDIPVFSLAYAGNKRSACSSSLCRAYAHEC